MKLLEQVGINVEEIKGGRIRQPDDFHVTQQQKKVVQLRRLHPELALVGAIGCAVKEITDVLPDRHRPIMTHPLARNASNEG